MSTIGLTTYMREFPLPINNQQKAYLLANSTGTPPVGASLNDLWVRYLRQKGFTGTLPEMQKKWAESIIGYETFSLSDALGALDGVFPNDLFRAGEQGVWYDPADMSTLFQDSAGTIPVTATGQPVGRMMDKSGNGFHATQSTAANRPTFRDVGGLRFLEFDGVNDSLSTSAINFTTTNAVSLFAGARKLSDATTGIIAELGATTMTTVGTFGFRAPRLSAEANIGWVINGGSEVLTTTAGQVFPAPFTFVAAASATIGTSQIMRINGAQQNSGTVNGGAGNFGNFQLFIGRRNSATLPFSGNLYGLAIRGTLTSAATTNAIEDWMALRTGIVLP